MLRRSAIRHDSTNRERLASIRVGPRRGCAFVRRQILVLLIASGLLPLALAQRGGHGGGYRSSAPHMAAPHMSAPPRPMQSRPHGYAPGNAYGNPPGRGGQHLGAWMQNHQGQSFASQEESLRHEQGFSRLPQQQQQRLIDRLHQLDAMPPEQRQRMIGRNENFERLSPERRQAFLGSTQELRAMDPARNQQVRGAFRVLRDMPPQQRERVLNSPAYRSMYSDHERQILGNLLSVEPYTPH